jgi:hypothetical protein
MWPDACPNCPIYGAEGAVNEPPLGESVPLPPTGEDIIRPYDEFKPQPMPPSPGPDALPDADLPGTPPKEDLPEDRPEPGDFGEQWKFPPLPGDQPHALTAEDGESSPPTNWRTSGKGSLVRRNVGP